MAHGLRRNEAAALLQRLHDVQGRVYAGGDPGELASVLSADVVWHVPGDNAIAGTYRGLREVTAYMLHRPWTHGNSTGSGPRDRIATEGAG